MGVKMTPIIQEVDPIKVGLDAQRLERIGAHFRPYVDDGRLAGWLVLVSRAGEVAYCRTYGQRDATGAPVEVDTLFRIFSMTKPVTAVAAMMCFEEGLFQLSDPVSRFIPSFADVRLWKGGSSATSETLPENRPIRIWHLMTHTAGLVYDFTAGDPALASLFQEAEGGVPHGAGLAGWCDAWASVPLVFRPGASWNYSVAIDVLGRVVEVVSGQNLDDFFAQRIFGPLGMNETTFQVRGDDEKRLGALYVRNPVSATIVPDKKSSRYGVEKPPYLSGGAGLVSSASDYLRFAEFLRRRGESEGARLLAPRTVDYMTRNHLPGNVDCTTFGLPALPDNPEPDRGQGYGLGLGVLVDPVAARSLATEGSYGWSGAANTFFWVDPKEQLTYIFLTQLFPYGEYSIDKRLSQLVYQAIVEDAL
jgi:CubicO group peptidase (beta-lactamase class C family)